MLSAEFAVKEIVRAYQHDDFSGEQFVAYEKNVYKSFRNVRVVGIMTAPIMLRARLMFFLLNGFFRLPFNKEVLSKFMYAKHPWKLLFSPSFYWTIIKSVFGMRINTR